MSHKIAACGGGTQSRYRSIAVTAAHGGMACRGGNNETQDCEEWHCPVDCVTSAWRWMSLCTVTCGVGTRVRVRSIESSPSNGGAKCPDLPWVED